MSNVYRVWKSYLSPERRNITEAIFCALAVAISTSCLGFVLGPAVDLLFHSPQAKKTVEVLPLLFREATLDHPIIVVPSLIIFVTLCRFFAQRGMTVALTHLGNRLVGRFQKEVFSSLVRSDISRIHNSHSGEHVAAILYDADLVREAASTGVIQFIQSVLIVFGCLTAMFFYDWSMALAVLLSGPVVGIITSKYLKATRRAATGAMTETAALSKALIESLGGVKVIQMLGMEASEEDRVGQVIDRRQTHLVKGAVARSMAAPATEAISGFLLAGLLGYAGWRALNGQISVGGLIGFITALGMAAQALRQLMGLQGTFSLGLSATNRLFEVLDFENSITDASGQLAAFPSGPHNIRFEKVSFGYKDQKLFEDLSFDIPARQSVAIVGPSGTGKSTLVNLLPRFFDVKRGRITINGTDIRRMSLSDLRANISFVTQEAFLFDTSIFQNIAFGKIDANHDEIVEAAKLADAHSFIMDLPDGYETRVGQGGSSLSGGQKQRISMARAFLQNAPILLLDEPTSALDQGAEERIQHGLSRLMSNKTTIIVAHRLSTIRNASKIVVLSQGKIAESGTHDELMERNGYYYSLIASRTAN